MYENLAQRGNKPLAPSSPVVLKRYLQRSSREVWPGEDGHDGIELEPFATGRLVYSELYPDPKDRCRKIKSDEQDCCCDLCEVGTLPA